MDGPGFAALFVCLLGLFFFVCFVFEFVVAACRGHEAWDRTRANEAVDPGWRGIGANPCTCSLLLLCMFCVFFGGGPQLQSEP